MDKSNVCIVGLGLLGGSYAMALSRKGHTVTAIDRDPAAIAYGLDRGLIQKGATADYAPLLQAAGLVVLCLYPHSILPWLSENQDLLSPGCLLTDVCGVKGGIVAEAQALLRRDVEFVPAHPMAGRERLGVQNADCAIFAPANFIITPTPANTPAAIARIEALAWELGFARVVRLSPKEHDAIIGYVSQLTHAIAVSLMLANDDPRLPLFTGDSFRDLTRIARIDETLWSELFLHNRDALLQQIDRFSAALAQLREQVAAENEAGLKAMFRISSQRRSWLNQPQQPGSR